MLLYYHQDLTDQLNMQEVTNDFICAREQRNTVFAKIFTVFAKNCTVFAKY